MYYYYVVLININITKGSELFVLPVFEKIQLQRFFDFFRFLKHNRNEIIFYVKEYNSNLVHI